MVEDIKKAQAMNNSPKKERVKFRKKMKNSFAATVIRNEDPMTAELPKMTFLPSVPLVRKIIDALQYYKPRSYEEVLFRFGL